MKKEIIAVLLATAMLSGCAGTSTGTGSKAETTESLAAGSEEASEINEGDSGSTTEDASDAGSVSTEDIQTSVDNEKNPVIEKVTYADSLDNGKSGDDYQEYANITVEGLEVKDSKYSALNEAMKAEYEERKSKAEEFKKYVEEAVEEYSDKEADYSSFPWPYEESITIKRADDKIVSYEASAVSYMGGAHGGIALTSHNFNAQTGEEYQLTDMIKNTDELIDYTVSKLEEEHENDEFFPEWKETVEKDILNTNEYPGGFTWTMGDGYLEFSFGQYEIAPYAAGIITVKIDTEQNDFLISEI